MVDSILINLRKKMGNKNAFTLCWHLHRLIFWLLLIKWGNMKRNIDSSHSSRLEQAQEQEALHVQPRKTQMLQARLKAYSQSALNSSFCYQNMTTENLKSPKTWCMWRMLVKGALHLFLERMNMSFFRKGWCVERLKKRSVCRKWYTWEQKLAIKATEETLHTNDCQVDGPDVTGWASRAVRIEKPWQSEPEESVRQVKQTARQPWSGIKKQHQR